MSQLLQFITQIQKIKKSQLDWAEKDPEDKAQALSQLLDKIKSHREELAHVEAGSSDTSYLFAQQSLIDEAVEEGQGLINKSLSKHHPLGILAIFASPRAQFRQLVPSLIMALQTGNAVVIVSTKENFIQLEIIKKCAIEILSEDLISIYSSEDELDQALCSHPVIAAVLFFGENSKGQGLLDNALRARKKVSFSFYGKNSALILEELDPKHYQSLAIAIVEGRGQLPWSPQRIFCLDKDLDRIAHELRAAIQVELINRPLLEKEDPGDLDMNLKALSGETIKVHTLGDSLALIQDLNMCSEIHQDRVSAGLVLINSVKYLHEMPKWVNTGYLQLCSSIWTGDQLKAEKLAQKLSVGAVMVNHWLPRKHLPFGRKQASYGYDPRWVSTYCDQLEIQSE